MSFPKYLLAVFALASGSGFLFSEAKGSVLFSLSGTAAVNPYISGSNTAVPAGTLFALVAAPTGNTFSVAANNVVAANTPLTVGGSLDGDQIFYLGTTSTVLGQQYASVSNFNNVNITSIAGDSFALVWFPSLTSSSTVAPAGTSYGVVSDQSSTNPDLQWILPTSSQAYSFGSSQQYTTFSSGQAGQANFQVQSAPEPGKSLLVFFGLAMIGFRRRR